ncbi:hypothetical protein [Streptomyces sp. ME19-01-6]|uniref:hypothetical protein n=1 Tax=Streptomyces sp. ME19-01-6 TaxID=3028686 RepID=UPI0029A097EE|nr:hypothetical protein [Streptomyces sp. ME19-01-6]MDX3227116.1 hypothetical protein [Streptomyces sp. ME19-01-6]
MSSGRRMTLWASRYQRPRSSLPGPYVRGVRRRRRGRGSRPASMRCPANRSRAGSSVSEPMTAKITTATAAY